MKVYITESQRMRPWPSWCVVAEKIQMNAPRKHFCFEQNCCCVAEGIKDRHMLGTKTVGIVCKQQQHPASMIHHDSPPACNAPWKVHICAEEIGLCTSQRSYGRQNRLVSTLTADTSITCQSPKLDSKLGCCDQQKCLVAPNWFICKWSHSAVLLNWTLLTILRHHLN